MKSYLDKLKTYVESHPIRLDDDCDFPALDSLYWHYSSCHSMTSEKAKQANILSPSSIHAPRVGSDSKDAQISCSIFGK